MTSDKQPAIWTGHKAPMGDWGILSSDGEFICNGLRHWNKDLILAAVNGCLSANPDNPFAVAGTIEEAFEALKEITELAPRDKLKLPYIQVVEIADRILAKIK